MDPRFISIDPVAKSMIDTKYEQECLKFSILLSFRVGTNVGSMVVKLCISHACCLIFAHYTYILLIFSFIRMPKKLKLKHEAEIKKLDETRRTEKKSLIERDLELRNTAWSLQISAGYIHVTDLLLGAVIFYASQDHLRDNSLPNLI